jgi:hypothetical protein
MYIWIWKGSSYCFRLPLINVQLWWIEATDNELFSNDLLNALRVNQFDLVEDKQDLYTII